MSREAGRRPETAPSTARGWAPRARAGLVIAVLAVAVLPVAALATSAGSPWDAPPALVSGIAVGVVVAGNAARLIPVGGRRARRDMGPKVADGVYGTSLALALLAALVRDVWVTWTCVGVLVVMAGAVAARKAP